MSEKVTEIILMIAPHIITILSMIGIVAKVIISLKTLKKDVLEVKHIEQRLDDMERKYVEENRELKKKLNETMTIIDRVQRKD